MKKSAPVPRAELVARAADALAHQSDLLSTRLGDVEQLLKNRGAGVSAWVALPLPADAEGRTWELGYARYSSNEWRLQLRELGPEGTVMTQRVLTDAPRHLRIAAADGLDALGLALDEGASGVLTLVLKALAAVDEWLTRERMRAEARS